MHHTLFHRALALPLLACVALASGAGLQAYNTIGHKWGSSRVNYYVNPSSKWVSASAAISAVQTAAVAWRNQSNANIELVYAGTIGGGSISYNGRNEVFFRNSTSSAVAQTYYWWDGSGRLVDFDMVHNEGSYRFYSGSGCSNGIYIENVGVHEFGHALGLGHSSASGASMQPKMSGYCDRTQLTLESDDISGIRSVYGTASSVSPTNTAPTVTINSPSNGLSLLGGAVVTVSGSASDSQDGNISGRLVWTSSLLGQIGVGSSFAFVVTAGTHTITAKVQDNGGLTASRSVSVSGTTSGTAPTSTPTLTARAYRENRMPKVDLSWTKLSASVDVFRNGVKIKTLTDRTTWTDADIPNAGTYTYKVCNGGVCSNKVTVTV